MSEHREDGKRISESARYREENGVGIWIVENLAKALEDGSLDPAEEHYREVAGEPDMNGVVVVLKKTDSIPPDVLEHVNDKWTELHELTDVKRSGYVGEGISRLAVANEQDATDNESRAFSELERAISWASEA